jgi:hypothetical protein
MARIFTSWKKLFEQINTGYQPGKHYMRGPGPAYAKKHGSLPQKQNGGDSRLVVAPSGMTRATPDTLSAQQG